MRRGHFATATCFVCVYVAGRRAGPVCMFKLLLREHCNARTLFMSCDVYVYEQSFDLSCVVCVGIASVACVFVFFLCVCVFSSSVFASVALVPALYVLAFLEPPGWSCELLEIWSCHRSKSGCFLSDCIICRALQDSCP